MTGQEQPNLEILWSTNEGPRPTHVGPSSIDEGQKSTAERPWSTDEGPSSTNEGPGPLVRVCSLLLSVPLDRYSSNGLLDWLCGSLFPEGLTTFMTPSPRRLFLESISLSLRPNSPWVYYHF